MEILDFYDNILTLEYKVVKYVYILQEAIGLLDKKEYLKSLVIINSSIKKEASNDSIFWRAVCLEELKQFY